MRRGGGGEASTLLLFINYGIINVSLVHNSIDEPRLWNRCFNGVCVCDWTRVGSEMFADASFAVEMELKLGHTRSNTR